MSSVYKINKGINKPIEFKGLKAQYIAYLAIGLIGLLVLFAVFYIAGVNMFICLGLTAILGTLLFMTVYRMSDTYGQHGLTKKLAKQRLPVFLKCTSRKLFLNLRHDLLVTHPCRSNSDVMPDNSKTTLTKSNALRNRRDGPAERRGGALERGWKHRSA